MKCCNNQINFKSTKLNLLNGTNIPTNKRHFKENGYKKLVNGYIFLFYGIKHNLIKTNCTRTNIFNNRVIFYQ